MTDIRSIQPTGIRLPDALKRQLKQMATTNRRSLNSEVLTILEKAVQSDASQTQNGPVTA